MLNTIKEHLIRYLILGISFLLIAIVLIFLIIKNNNGIFINVIPQTENLEQQIFILGLSLSNIAVFLSALTIIITAIWACYQYDKSVKMKQQEKASIIAQRFSNEVMDYLFIINQILTSSEFVTKNILTVIPRNVTKFDKNELLTLIKNESLIQEYLNFIYNDDTNKQYRDLLDEEFKEDKIKTFPKSFASLVNFTLNELEAICMDISSNIAGSLYIYPSLNQAFLNTIHMLYYSIAYENNNYPNKYYINIIAVYKSWYSIRQKEENNYEASKSKITDITNKGIKQIKKINKKTEKELEKIRNKKPESI